MLIALATASLVGCDKKIEVKQDTPQAAMASVIKVYAANRPELLTGLIDPSVLWMDARASACSGVFDQQTKCLDVLIQAHDNPAALAGVLGHRVDECAKLNVKDCTCGAVGAAAAKSVGPLAQSDFYYALKVAKFDPTTCSITDASPVEANKLSNFLPEFSDTSCDEAGASDKYATVNVTCSRGPMTFVFRAHDASWRMVGVEHSVYLNMWLEREDPAADAKKKKQQDELNKDLK